MKQFNTLLLIVFCFFYGCSPDKKANSAHISSNSLSIDFVPPQINLVEMKPMNTRGLNGRVKTYRYTSNPVMNPKTLETEETNDSHNYTCWFDESGREVRQEIRYNKYRDERQVYEYIYDEIGKKKTYIDESTYKGFGKYKRTDYYYNSDGKVRLAERSNAHGRIFESYTNQYDSDGRLIESITTDSQGRYREVETWEYGADDGYTYTSLEYSDLDYLLLEKSVSKYDKDGNIVWFNRSRERGTEWIINGRSKPDLTLYREAYYSYDTKNRMVRETFRNRNSETMQFVETSTIYDYDSNNKKIKEVKINSDGQKTRERYFKYNQEGDLIEEKQIDTEDGTTVVESYTYQYDNLRNWIRKVIYENGEPKEVKQRIIDYYTPSTTFQDVMQTGVEHYNSETFKDAVVAFTEVINSMDEAPKNLHYNRGCAKLMLRDYRGAIQDYTEEITRYPKSAKDCYYYRGIASLLLSEKDSGCIDLSRAGELEHPEAFSSIAKYCQ